MNQFSNICDEYFSTLRNEKSSEQIADKLIVRVEIHLEQQRLIQIFVASLDMNPSVLQRTGLEHDKLRGKKINQYQNIAFISQICNFGTQLMVNYHQLIVRIDYNLLLSRHECLTGKYAPRKIHAKPYAAIEWRRNCEQSHFKSKIGDGRTQTRNRRVDQRRALKPQAASSTGFGRRATLALLAALRLRFFSQISGKRGIARSLLKWGIFHFVTCDDIDHIIDFPAFHGCFRQQSV